MVASYVLAELRSPAERRRVVQSLWERTRGLLLLVEPGTPVGSANVREARTQASSHTTPQATWLQCQMSGTWLPWLAHPGLPGKQE